MSFNVKNFFGSGIVNSDVDPRFLDENQMSVAENVQFFREGSDGVVTNMNGNKLISGIKLMDSDKYVGQVSWDTKLYLFYTTATDNYIQQYDTLTESVTLVCRGDLNIPLSTSSDYSRYVLSPDVLDGIFLFWTGGLKGDDGELSGYKEHARINIPDAISSPTTQNISFNPDRPNKLTVRPRFDSEIVNNQLKDNSFVFYQRHTNKYNEKTALSYPSICVSVPQGVSGDSLSNSIDVVAFTVPDDIERVEILVSNDSTGTFEVVRVFDTSANKLVPSFTFTNSFERVILDADSSNIINFDHPETSTELAIAANHVVLGDVITKKTLTNSLGNQIDKNALFGITTTGLDSNINEIFNGDNTASTSLLPVTVTFVNGSTYDFTFSTFRNLSVDYGFGFFSPVVYNFSYTYNTGDDYVTKIKDILKTFDPTFSTSDDSGDHNFTITGARGGNPSGTANLKITNSFTATGLNSRFQYKFGVVFLDGAGRNIGVTNVTKVNFTGDNLTFEAKTFLTGRVTAPSWAKKYMIVRDKVNTSLSYSFIGSGAASAVKTGYTMHEVDTLFYINYIASFRGKKITVYSESLKSNVEVDVMTAAEKTEETGLSTENEYIYVHNSVSLLENSLILFQPNKSVDSEAELFYESSDVFDINEAVFQGDGLTLSFYDTKIAVGVKSFGTVTEQPFPIMITDSESLKEINHMGRGAYTILSDVDMSESSTVLHSQRYDSSVNYNGTNAFSAVFNNFKDLDLSNGKIIKLFYDDNDLLVGQQRKWSKILLNKSILTSLDGEESVASSKSFFNDVRPYLGEFGITDKKSFAVDGFRKYGVDENRGVATRISNDGITVLNKGRNKEIRDAFKSHIKSANILGTVDQNEEAYIFNISNSIFTFSEINSNQSYSIFHAETSVDHFNVYSKRYSISADSNLYQSNVQGEPYLYGSVFKNKIQFSVKTNPNQVKDFGAILLESTTPFDVTIETQENTTTISKEDFIKREDVWYADIPKDENGVKRLGVGTISDAKTPGQLLFKSNPTNLRAGDKVYNGDTELGVVGSYEGNRIQLFSSQPLTPAGAYITTKRPVRTEGKSIKGQYAVITLECDNQEFKLFSVGTVLNVSSN